MVDAIVKAATVIVSGAELLNEIVADAQGHATDASGFATTAAGHATTASDKAALADRYANDETNVDVPGGAVGDRGSKYWSIVSQQHAADALANTQAEIAAFEFLHDKYYRPNVFTGAFTLLSVDVDGANISLETTVADGTLHYMMIPAGAPEPRRAQIEAGTDGAGATAAWKGTVAVSAIDSYTAGPTGLASATTYEAWAMHISADGQYSARRELVFTTTTAQFTGAMNGTPGTIVASTGTASLTNTIADSDGNTNAIRWTSLSDSAVGFVTVSASGTFINGLNRIRFRARIQTSSAPLWLRVRILGLSATSGDCFLNMSTGAITGASGWSTAPVTTDLGGGWRQFDAQINCTGFADLAGSFNLYMSDDGTSSNCLRDGKQVDLHRVIVSAV